MKFLISLRRLITVISSKWRRPQFYLLVWYALKNRSLTFFTVANPKLEGGGMFGESKLDIHEILHPDFVPKTIPYDNTVKDINKILIDNNLKFPLIIKPDTGSCGKGVYKADDIAQLEFFMENIENQNLIIQEFIELEREFSIMYYCFPATNETVAYSVIEKKYPFIIGDGQSTINELIKKLNNNRLRMDFLNKKFEGRQDEVLPKNEKIIIDYIGNYSSGATFERCDVDIPPSLGKTIHKAITETAEIYFGRLDMKANSIPELLAGEFQIIEVNGAKAEPLEIYTPNIPDKEKMKILRNHWKTLHIISKQQREKGHQPIRFMEAYHSTIKALDSRHVNKLKQTDS